MATSALLPAFFLSHGGGPAFGVIEPAMHPAMSKDTPTAKFLRGLPATVPGIKAILMISAHWEAEPLAVTTWSRGRLLFDYYGFPPQAYELKYTCPGSPELAGRVKALLGARGMRVQDEPERGLDHGAFVPLMVMFPAADVPVVQLSLHPSLSTRMHIDIGRALAPLRREGVLILGSGFMTHNQRRLQFDAPSDRVQPWAAAFAGWVEQSLTGDAARSYADRLALLERLHTAPHFRDAHPREEHIIPLLVAAGAADASADPSADPSVDASSSTSALGPVGEQHHAAPSPLLRGKATKVHDAWALGSASFAAYRFD